MPWRTVLFDALPAECYSLSVLEVFSADRCHYLGFTVGASPWVIPPRSVSKMYPVTKAVAQRYMRLCSFLYRAQVILLARIVVLHVIYLRVRRCASLLDELCHNEMSRDHDAPVEY